MKTLFITLFVAGMLCTQAHAQNGSAEHTGTYQLFEVADSSMIHLTLLDMTARALEKRYLTLNRQTSPDSISALLERYIEGLEAERDAAQVRHDSLILFTRILKALYRPNEK